MFERPDLEDYLMQKFATEGKITPKGIQLRQLLPADLCKRDWCWLTDEGFLTVAGGRMVAVTGILSQRLYQIEFWQPDANGTLAGAFTNGESVMALILGIEEPIWYHISTMDFTKLYPPAFVLTGIVAENKGTTVAV